jgi:hypothetical protein
MFADVSVPAVGLGVVGVVGAAMDVLLGAVRLFGPAAKLSIASEMLERQRKTPSKLRVLIKPDLEEDFFFMRIIPGELIGQTQARGAVPVRRLSQSIVVCSASTFLWLGSNRNWEAPRMPLDIISFALSGES